MTKSRGIFPPKRFWTDRQLELLCELYPDNRTLDLVGKIGRSVLSIYEKANQLGIKKSASFLASGLAGRFDGMRGGATRFKKNHETWNKGTHYAAGGRSAETWFKAGQRCGVAVKLYQPIGSERISKDGYLQRKINDDLPLQKRWRGVHLILWEEANGPLPAGHAIVFKDDDKKNIALGNFELVTRAELMRRNSYHNNYPKEVALAIQLRGALVRKINNRMKKEANEQRDNS